MPILFREFTLLIANLVDDEFTGPSRAGTAGAGLPIDLTAILSSERAAEKWHSISVDANWDVT